MIHSRFQYPWLDVQNNENVPLPTWNNELKKWPGPSRLGLGNQVEWKRR
jgi:hypothetical protein